jgi:hypothetical protein
MKACEDGATPVPARVSATDRVSTKIAAADLGGWDRRTLECDPDRLQP